MPHRKFLPHLPILPPPLFFSSIILFSFSLRFPPRQITSSDTLSPPRSYLVHCLTSLHPSSTRCDTGQHRHSLVVVARLLCDTDQLWRLIVPIGSLLSSSWLRSFLSSLHSRSRMDLITSCLNLLSPTCPRSPIPTPRHHPSFHGASSSPLSLAVIPGLSFKHPLPISPAPGDQLSNLGDICIHYCVMARDSDVITRGLHVMKPRGLMRLRRPFVLPSTARGVPLVRFPHLVILAYLCSRTRE